MREFNPTPDIPHTCLWCGKKLVFVQHDEYRTEERVGPTGLKERCEVRTGTKKRIHGAPGPYGDGFFCTLSCGYQFGCELARKGRRLIVSK